MSKPRFEGIHRVDKLGPRNERLVLPLTLIDSQGRRWIAPSGSVVNGSSIPRFFWRIAGSPYVGYHRKASVIHDVACEKQWAPDSRNAHRLYFEGQIAEGENPWVAWLRWLAVRLFGPRWPKVPFWKRCYRTLQTWVCWLTGAFLIVFAFLLAYGFDKTASRIAPVGFKLIETAGKAWEEAL